MARLAFDFLLLRRTVTLLRIFFSTWRSTRFLLAVAVLLFSIADQVATYCLGVLPKQFHILLGSREESAFDRLVVMAFGLVFFKAASFALIKLLSSLLYLRCRRIFGFVMHRLYFKRHAFYNLTNSLDNPDQRMTQDIEKCTRIFACELLGPLLLSPFVVFFYTYLTFNSSGFLGPLTIYAFFITATLVNRALISRTIPLVAEQEKKEGDFRARHLEVRANLEPIAFYQSGFTENVFTNNKLKELLKTQKHLVIWQLWLNFAANCFDFFGSNLSYVIIAIAIFVQNKYEDKVGPELNGIISENAFYYMYLINSFTRLITLSQSVSQFGGVTHRVIELYEELNRVHDDRLETERPPSTVPSSVVILASDENKGTACGFMKRKTDDAAGRIQRELHGRQAHGILASDSDEDEAEFLLGENASQRNWQDDGTAVSLDSVTVVQPNDHSRVLIMNLTLQIMQNRNLLVTGENGAGKSALLRLIAGLWTCISGKVERHWKLRPSQLFFVPQRPYFPYGHSLRQQLVYPLKALPVEKDLSRLSHILEWVRMDYLLARCNGFDSATNWDWNDALSPGELQRLSIGRVLYHKPRVAFLDEATSCLGFDMESSLYKVLRDEGITVVSTGQRCSLKQFHELELNLRGRHWTLVELDSVRSMVTEPSLGGAAEEGSRA
ncbi:hypothetical protein niasHS_010827 [Heterodera schachtii]|uniref:ABC transporter n=1 Tax=Heterodera schachtii TaxID=97005 RepID=A0ABD2J0B1_HETSC